MVFRLLALLVFVAEYVSDYVSVGVNSCAASVVSGDTRDYVEPCLPCARVSVETLKGMTMFLGIIAPKSRTRQRFLHVKPSIPMSFNFATDDQGIPIFQSTYCLSQAHPALTGLPGSAALCRCKDQPGRE